MVCVFVCVLVAQSCLTLCDSVDCSWPASSVHGILQARILEWITIPFSRDLPNPGIKLESLALQADSLLSEPQRKPHELLQTGTELHDTEEQQVSNNY